jgi:hypothetical protein
MHEGKPHAYYRRVRAVEPLKRLLPGPRKGPGSRDRRCSDWITSGKARLEHLLSGLRLKASIGDGSPNGADCGAGMRVPEVSPRCRIGDA